MNTMTEALADFLLARIAEDVKVICEADSDVEFRVAWLVFTNRDGSMAYTTVAADHRDDVWVANGTPYQADSRLTVTRPFFDARRAVAESKAKRAIIERHRGRPYPNERDDPIDFACSGRGGDWAPVDPDACPELRVLALPYADHPDYREEWRP